MASTKELETELEVLKAALAIERERNRKLLVVLAYLRKVLGITTTFMDKLNDRNTEESDRQS